MRISAPPRGKAGAWTTDKPAALLAAEGERERQCLSPKTHGPGCFRPLRSHVGQLELMDLKTHSPSG